MNVRWSRVLCAVAVLAAAAPQTDLIAQATSPATLAVPASTTASGWVDAPIAVAFSVPAPGTTIRYTLDGSKPTPTTGTQYTQPIQISHASVLRAATFAPNSAPSPSLTRTFLFLDDVIHQAAKPAGFPASWGADSTFPDGRVPADYEMDSDPLRTTPANPRSPIDPIKATRLREGLRELPILSLVMKTGDMFGPGGLYPLSQQKQPPIEKECALEMILADGTSAFSVTGGIRIHGNASRTPAKSPKHGFKLTFKREFGAASLRYKLFADSTAEKFDDLVLRPGFNGSWLHWSDVVDDYFGDFQRSRATLTRDAWLKETFRDMGHPASHNRFVHLFINGLYWGIYDLTEQPTDSFAERTFGGAKEDYDVFDQGQLASGTTNAYHAMLALSHLELETNYTQMKQLLDLPEFIDYMLLHYFVGHQDWGASKNWFAIRPRAEGGRFQYLPWDGENILLSEKVVAPSGGPNNVPSGLHAKLLANAEYRLEFADHVQRQMITTGGALTQDANIARWKKWQALLDKPIVAESARWGDYRRDVHPFASGSFELYTRERHWLAENNRILNSYFVHRGDIVLAQFRAAGLYPSIDAPALSRSASQSAITLSAARGTIYYTVDGGDPRLSGGTVSPRAIQYRGTPIQVPVGSVVKARALNGRTWSALSEAK